MEKHGVLIFLSTTALVRCKIIYGHCFVPGSCDKLWPITNDRRDVASVWKEWPVFHNLTRLVFKGRWWRRTSPSFSWFIRVTQVSLVLLKHQISPFLLLQWFKNKNYYFRNNFRSLQKLLPLLVCYLVLIQLTCLTDLETCWRTVCMTFPSFQTLTNPPKSADKMDTRSKLPGHLKWYRHY